MQQIKQVIWYLLIVFLLSHILACHKKEQGPTYVNIVAQDPSYRLGKWYSVSNGADFNFSTNPLLDTIWFISDSLAGWSAFGGNPYVFWPTYFSGPYYIVYLAPDPLHAGVTDTVLHQCAMSGDTFIIYWPTITYQYFAEEYVKMSN